jgi:hypothetical protein
MPFVRAGWPGIRPDNELASNAREANRRRRAYVTNPGYYIPTVVILILASCVAAVIFGFAAGHGF